jgi:methionine-gamma-lyase
MSHLEKKRLRTRAIHAGERIDPTTRAASPSIVPSVTYLIPPEFAAKGFDADVEAQTEESFIYARWSNPTARQLEQKLASLEESKPGSADCISFSSGMAAATALFLNLLKSGDHLVISEVSYVGVAEFVRRKLTGFGVEVSLIDTSDPGRVRAAMRPNTKLVYIETPANPILRLTDIAACAQIAHAGGAKLAVDSTFATPLATQPLALGADFVMHSLTKYLCGHGDALGGALIASPADVLAIREDSGVRLGATLSPFNAYLIMRGIDTLALRMAAHEASALRVAQFLEAHPRVKRVLYPGLASHPQHALAKTQMANFSGMLSFQVHGDGLAVAQRMAGGMQVFHYAVSLGHQRSLIVYIGCDDINNRSYQLTGAACDGLRAQMGEGLFRTSIGLEDPDDLIEDLERVLAD